MTQSNGQTFFVKHPCGQLSIATKQRLELPGLFIVLPGHDKLFCDPLTCKLQRSYEQKIIHKAREECLHIGFVPDYVTITYIYPASSESSTCIKGMGRMKKDGDNIYYFSIN